MAPSVSPIHQSQPVSRQRAIPSIWHKVFGTLKGKNIDGLRYQKTIRAEWEKRLRKQLKLGAKKSGHRH